MPCAPHGAHARAPGQHDADIAGDEEGWIFGRAFEQGVDHCAVEMMVMGSEVYWDFWEA